jgi:hypothetical protein
MRAIIICFISIFVLSACSPASVENGGNNPGNDFAVDLLQDFKSYIAAAEDPTEVKEYLDTLMAEGNAAIAFKTETADALVLEYLSYLETVLSLDQSDLASYPEEASFKPATGEGGFFPVIDYHFIDAYSGRVSQEITEYARFMSLDSDKPWAFDAGIVIPIRELVDRIAQAEQFITNYPDFLLKDQVLAQYERYLTAFLAGLPNTPLFPYGTCQADHEFIDASDYFMETYPSLVTAETIGSYQEELEQMNYTAPYTYSEYEKQAEFSDHIYKLVNNTVGRLNVV